MQCEDYENEVALYNKIYSEVETSISVHKDLARVRYEYVRLFRVFPNEIHDDVATRDLSFNGEGGPIPGRLFVPKGASDQTPAIIYIHGGGYIAGDISVADGIASDLAATLGIRVVSFGYRLSPDTHYPGALLDTVSVAEQVFERSAELGIDADKIMLSGESCGGNLSVTAAAVLSRKGNDRLKGIVPLNGIFDVHRWARQTVTNVSESFAKEIYEFTYGYLGPHFTWTEDTGASPLRARSLGKLPPAFFWSPVKDPLHLEVLQIAERMREEGGSAKVVLDDYAVHGALRARRQFKFADNAFQDVCDGIADLLEIPRKPVSYGSKIPQEQNGTPHVLQVATELERAAS